MTSQSRPHGPVDGVIRVAWAPIFKQHLHGRGSFWALPKRRTSRVRVVADVQNFALRVPCVNSVPPVRNPKLACGLRMFEARNLFLGGGSGSGCLRCMKMCEQTRVRIGAFFEERNPHVPTTPEPHIHRRLIQPTSRRTRVPLKGARDASTSAKALSSALQAPPLSKGLRGHSATSFCAAFGPVPGPAADPVCGTCDVLDWGSS